MRLLLSAGIAAGLFAGVQSANAADLPAKGKTYTAPVVAPVANWSGCYIGVHGGGGWGNARWSDPTEFANHDIDGWLAGGQVGCDYQAGQWVFGVEATGAWANLKGDSLESDGVLRDFTKIDALGTIGARAGLALDRTLPYITGGAAWSRSKYHIECASDGGVTCNSSSLIGTTYRSVDDTRWGWFLGVGVEYAFAPNWSIKAEYNYMDFGTESLTLKGPIATTTQKANFDQHVHVGKVGVNYRFGGP